MAKVLQSICALFLLGISMHLLSRDVLLEFKGAYFVPTETCVRNIFHHGGALFGPEVTVRVCEEKNWYLFASIDFLTKKGHSLGLCEPTKIQLVPLALGAKYFVPFCYGNFYVGLGVQPVHLKTKNCSQSVNQVTSNWGGGGIAKVGTYFDVSCNFFVDLFADYSFVRIGCDKCLTVSSTTQSSSSSFVIPLKTNMSGVILGVGVGYKFN